MSINKHRQASQFNWWRKPEITKDLRKSLKKYSKVVIRYILQLAGF